MAASAAATECAAFEALAAAYLKGLINVLGRCRAAFPCKPEDVSCGFFAPGSVPDDTGKTSEAVICLIMENFGGLILDINGAPEAEAWRPAFSLLLLTSH